MTFSIRWAATALLSSAAVTVLSPSAAEAVVISVGGSFYDVSVLESSFDNASHLFATLPAGQMPWWGDEDLAYQVATEVSNQLGDGPNTGYGPVFAYALSGTQIVGVLQNTSDPLDAINDRFATATPVQYAVASAPATAPASVPGPLPLFGAAAALGWSRQLRRRLLKG